ncbi:glutamate--cysteine ligase [Ningiella sp. W23]|uniref:glutamate--cysteine ligase n=1 Tax=Ningiella sp. W23 TaxID=3023715 RepID=UPI00375704E7
MSDSNKHFEQALAFLEQSTVKASLRDIKHGVERETLRVNGDGSLAKTPHPPALGASLTHDWITTDFSESLLEFITPPESNISTTIKQLIDIHKFTYQSIGDEYLWPMSMPCFIDEHTNIPIARYGSSNVAKMKEVYRTGLHNRYGSMMQVISGVHFNFSLPDTFWQLWCERHGKDVNKTSISSQYFALVRNFKRFAWMIPYLFGASPALCGSFINHRKVPHAFETVGKGTLYLPHATSLRMSDLGYTSSAQSSLQICYNDLSSYVSTLRDAINMPAEQYQHIAAGEGGKWDQLNKNVLQIENELYSPIRPKQVARSLEKPTDALEDRGVSYLEIRALDVNPFSPVGIDAEQIYFLDVFLLYCLLQPSESFDAQQNDENQQNFVDVVLKGREPGLTLSQKGNALSLKSWASSIFDDLKKIAAVLDATNEVSHYGNAISVEQVKVQDPEQSFSGKWLGTLKSNQIDNSILGMELAREYKGFAHAMNYSHMNDTDFKRQTELSLQAQAKVEAGDSRSFDDFMKDYFAK